MSKQHKQGKYQVET